MKLHLLYIKTAFNMSKSTKNYNSEDDFELDEQTKDQFVQNLTINDYINNEKTRTIMLDEHQYQFDINLRHKIAHLYYQLNSQFHDHNLFLKNDPNNTGGDRFADFVFNLINIKYHINIFHKDPDWTISLF